MAIKVEATDSGAKRYRDPNTGEFANKPLAEVDPSSIGFGRPAPRFVLRDPDENPKAFTEEFGEKHGQALVNALTALPRVTPSRAGALMLEDIRSGYPVYQEEAAVGDYENAVMDVRELLSEAPELDRERLIEQVAFSVHMEMKHRIVDTHFTTTGNTWADLTNAPFVDDEEATMANKDAWMELADRAMHNVEMAMIAYAK